MTTYFPADVSLRVEGNDLQGAQKLFPDAANLLYKALEFQRAGDRTNVNFFEEGKDGSLISVKLAGNLKIVYIAPGRVVQPPPHRVLQKPGEEVPTLLLYPMYSGMVRPIGMAGTPMVIQVTNPDPPPVGTVSALEQFHPDRNTASVYGLDLTWQNPIKLGVDYFGGTSSNIATSAYPKPGMYSGSMKRVVQAVLGIGKVETDTVGYISGELPLTAPDLSVWNQYACNWDRTHGIHKGTDGTIWLVEISKLNGILAMPLPIFNKTDTFEYYQMIAGIGDADSLNILLEFGGIPSGEKFPTGTDLADAITAGLVLRLKTPAQIAEFYTDTSYTVDKSGAWVQQCWAFSESGRFANNLCFWYRDIVTAHRPVAGWAADGMSGSALEYRYMQCQHYRITFDITSDPTGAAIGVGTAEFQLLETGIFLTANDQRLYTGGANPELYSHPLVRVPLASNTESLLQWTFFGRDSSGPETVDPPLVHVFYDGERLETVRYYENRAGFPSVGSFSGDSLTFGTPTGSIFDCVGLIVPSYCREGYLLVYGVPTGHGAGELYSVFQSGYFSQVGAITFDTMLDPVYSTKTFGLLYSMISWIAMWCCVPASPYNSGAAYGMGFGAVFNAGPTAAFVMSHGLFVESNVDSAGPLSRLTETRYDKYAVDDFAVPANAPASTVTFVGSV